MTLIHLIKKFNRPWARVWQQLLIKMSILSSVEPANLSELPQGLTEVFVDNIRDNANEVAKFHLHQDYAHLAYGNGERPDKEWSQVFDLGDTFLVCLVKDQKLEMRLVHFNERPLQEVRDFNTTNGSVSRPFASTESDIMAEIKLDFKRYEKAKIQFDAPIVANLCLIDNKKRGGEGQPATVFKGSSVGVFGKAPEHCNYTLVLATQSNHVYHVYFERHYLQRGRTIHVKQSDSGIFAHLQGSRIRCFEQVHDFVNKRELFVIGSASYVPPQQDAQSRRAAVSAAIEGTLTFLDETRTPYQLAPPRYQGQNGQGGQSAASTATNQDNSWLGRLSRNFRGLTPAAQPQDQQAAAPQVETGIQNKFRQQADESLVAPDTNIKNMHGVLSMKVLTNNLLAVAYTNGLLRIVQISNLEVLVETNLLDDSELGKVVECSLASATQQAVTNYQQTRISKSICVGLSLNIESPRTQKKHQALHVLCLRFDNIAVVDIETENDVLLGNDCSLIHMRQQVMPEGIAISSLTPGDDSAFLYTTFNTVTRETSIFSTSVAQPIWDKGSQEVHHQISDKVNLPVDLIQSVDRPELQQALRAHYIERITVPGRFTPESIKALLVDHKLFDQNQSIKENLIQAVNKIAIENLPNLLANFTEIEAQNSRILALSVPLDRKSNWRVIVRPLGVSIMAETSYISCIRSAIDLGSNEGESYWATHDTKLLIEYLSLVKTCLADNLHMLSQRIVEEPTSIRESASKCIRNAKNQDAILKLKYMLRTAAPDIQDQLTRLDKRIIERLVLERAGKKSPQGFSDMNIDSEQTTQPYRLSELAMKAQEELIRQEFEALLSLLTDLYLGQLLLATATQSLNEERLQKHEGWIRQLSALLKTFNADYKKTAQALVARPLASHQLASTADFKISRHGNVLQHLLTLGQEEAGSESSAFYTDDPQDMTPLLLSVIGSFCHKHGRSDSPTFVPSIVKQLCKLNQHAAALDYLRVIPTQTLGTLYAQVFCMTCLAGKTVDKGQFMHLTLSLIGQTLQLNEKKQSRVNLEQAFLANRPAAMREAIRANAERIAQNSLDTRLQFLILCATELSSSEVITLGGPKAELLTAYFIKTCLQFESQTQVKSLADWTPDELDYLNGCLFDSQRSSSSSVDLLYKAAISIKNIDKRQHYLLKFFEAARSANRPQHVRAAVLTRCPFSQCDITLLIEAIQNKLATQISLQQVQNEKWLQEATSLIQLYHDVSQLYSWQDQFVRFSWSLWQNELKALMTDARSNSSRLQTVLTLAVHLMSLSYTACQSCGKDFYFHVAADEIRPALGINAGRAKKRGYKEAMESGRMDVDTTEQQVQTAQAEFWSNVDKLRARPDAFSSGSLTKVNIDSVLGALMLCKAQLVCLEQLPGRIVSNDPAHLSKVLAELNKVDLAVELALSNKISPAFAIATAMDRLQKRDIREGENAEEDAMRQDLIDDQVERYLRRIKAEHLSELAQYLVALKIDFSASFKSKLVELKQVAYVVGCYLSPEVHDIVRAVDFISSSRDDEAMRILIHSDLNQVVNLLQQADCALKIFREERQREASKRDSVKESLAQGSRGSLGRNFMASGGGGSSGLAVLEGALQGQSAVIGAILAEQQDAGYHSFTATRAIDKHIEKCEKNIKMLEQGIQKLQHVLKMEMGQRRR